MHARFIIVKMVPDDSSFIVILSLGLNQHIRYRNGVNAKQWILEENIKPYGKNTAYDVITGLLFRL